MISDRKKAPILGATNTYRGNQYTKKVDKEDEEKEVVEQVVPPLDKEHKSRQAKAKASKTNRGSVERMDRLDRERPACRFIHRLCIYLHFIVFIFYFFKAPILGATTNL